MPKESGHTCRRMLFYMSGKAVIYIRQSKEKRDSISEDVQRSACLAHCARLGLEVVAEFVEIGVSGYRDYRKRPKFPEVLEGIAKGEYDTLVIYRWSRLSRNARDALNIWNLIEDVGARIESAAESMDTSGAAGALGAKQMLLFAEFESRLKSEQFKEAHTRRVERGLPRDGGGRYGYRYEAGKYHPDATQAEGLRRAYDLYMSGNSLQVTAETLNAEGYLTSAGGVWRSNRVSGVLDSGFAFGLLSLDTGERWEKGSHTPIFTQEEWDSYRAERVARSQGTRERPTREVWDLARIARCGLCGAHLTHVNRERGYLRCSLKNTGGGCAGVRVKEGEVWEAFNKALHDPKSASHANLHDAITEATAEQEDVHRQAIKAVRKAERDLADIDAQLGKLASGWSTGLLDDTGYRQAQQDAQTRRAETEQEHTEALAQVEKTRPLVGLDRINSLVDMTSAEVNRLYRAVVREISFTDTEVTVRPVVGTPFTYDRPSPRVKYPWDEWLDGTEKHLEHGTDYMTDNKAMRQTIRGAAKRRGLRVKCQSTKNGLHITYMV